MSKSAPRSSGSSSTHSRGRKVEAPRKTSLMMFYWAIGIVAVVGVAILITYVTGATKTSVAGTAGSSGQQVPVGVTSEGFHFKGNPSAPVTVVEYADFECPACAQVAQPPYSTQLLEYIEEGKVRLIFHEYPLSYHTSAPAASIAARCAGEQDAFWEMHDLLFQQRTVWINDPSPRNFAGLASQGGVERGAFIECMQSGKYDQAIADAAVASREAGVTGTPNFIVNGSDPLDYSELVPAIEAALASQGE